ncbi:hypothetical protein [Moheibacter sediminis]|nr:hypothetical protein [Moheibacter sediminis]
MYEVSSLEDIGSIESFKELTNFFRGTYSSLQIPTQTAKLLDEALEDIDLVSLREEFITLGCALQYAYCNNIGSENDEDLKTLALEKEDIKGLFRALRKYLFSTSHSEELPSITIKIDTGDNINIKNPLVLKTIYGALCDKFLLTRENYVQQKEGILSKTLQIKPDKFSENVKVEFINAIYNFIYSENNPNRPRIDKALKKSTLEFIAAFFALFEVPINNSAPFVNNPSIGNISQIYDNVDIKNLKHYIERPPSIEIK